MAMIFEADIPTLELILGAFTCLLILLSLNSKKRVPSCSYPYTLSTPVLFPRDFRQSLTFNNPQGTRLPPGPRGRPLLGNIFDMPTHHAWETFTQWGKEYGDLVHIKSLGQPTVIVNSMEVANDLLEKRSSIYSDRFDFPMLTLMGFMVWDWGFFRYGEDWRRHRRMFHQKFHPAAATAYHHVQTNQARAFLRRLHNSPDDFTLHLRHLAAAIILKVMYGIKVLPQGDHYIEMAETGMLAVAEACNPGAFLVDILPILKYVPEWVPGAGFQKKARIWRVAIIGMAIEPFMAVKRALSSGTAPPSVIASLLDELSGKSDARGDEEDIIRNVGAVAYAAGADTTNTALTWFILSMALYPEVQRKAQLELDTVLGTERLPEFEDRKNLPYINALCKEIHRWCPVVPLGVAHRVMQDDIYGDYYIPGGSIVVGNAWAILRDEKHFGSEPEKFRPERFLYPGVPDPTVAFGFGRRICPGRHMADNTIFITAASMLKIFNITHAKDNLGNDIPIKPTFTADSITRPEPFRCSIKPRSASAESLLLNDIED